MDDNTQLDISSNQADMDVRSERRLATKKTNKPLIEKRRRARINECLQQLKEIIVKDRQLDNVRGNRLEKADILEMTVEYIRQLSNEGSPVSCLQTAYERGVERCVREMSEFMLSQRDVIDSSVTHKLTNHCRKMLGHHYPQADDVQSQLTGNKRTIPTTTENMADSSTSPKRYRIDDDNESNIDINGEDDFPGGDNHRLRETPRADIITSVQSASPVPIALHFNSLISSCTKSPHVQTASPNPTPLHVRLTTNPEPVVSSNTDFPVHDYRDHVLASSCKDSTATNPANSSIKQTITSSQSFSPSVETEAIPPSITPTSITPPTSNFITSTSITPPLSNFISKPVFFSCPGNIFILVDKPAILPQPQSLLPGSVIPVEQNVLTLLPTPMTYKLPTPLTYTSVDRACTEIGLPRPSTSGNCGPTFSLQSMSPQNQTTVNNLTSGSENPVSVLLNPGILVKHEPANNMHFSLGQHPTVQYLLHSGDQQHDDRQVFQHSIDTFSHFQNTSGQIFQNGQGNNLQIFQNGQPLPIATVQQHQTKQMLQKSSSPSGGNTANVANGPAGSPCSNFNHASIIPEKKLPEDQHRHREHRQPEYKMLEHSSAESKLPEQNLTDHKLPYNNPLECKLPENKLIEYAVPKHLQPESVSPREHKQPPTISQASQLSQSPTGNPIVHSLNVCERCSPDLEDSSTDLRHAHPGEPCLFLSASSRLSAPGHNLSSSNETSHSTMPLDGSSSILNAEPSTRMDATTNKPTRVAHSTSQSVTHTPDSPIESCHLYKIPSPMSRAVSHVLTSSNPDTHEMFSLSSPDTHEMFSRFSPDTHEMFSQLQERSEVLDLSWKVPVDPCCRSERTDVDINNNAVGSSALYGSSNHIPPRHFLGAVVSNQTNKMNIDCISNLTITKTLSNQAYIQKVTVGSSPCSRSLPGLDRSSVWRPWGNNPEMKELH